MVKRKRLEYYEVNMITGETILAKNLKKAMSIKRQVKRKSGLPSKIRRVIIRI